MSRIGADGIRYGTNDVASYTQPSASIRYKGGWLTSVSSAATPRTSATTAQTDEPNSSGTGIPPDGQGLVTVGFDYWITWNKVNAYNVVTGTWDYVRLNVQTVRRQYSDVFGNYFKVMIYHEAEGGAHAYIIKYYTFE
jgi:hypothetical protein